MEDKKCIDFVYLWVDGNDKSWQLEKQKWQKNLNLIDAIQTNECRFIDNQELKYSMRALAQNAPWINKIFIVTNGQIPSWLDTSHPKIKIITHGQIMPSDALPTFNSEAIETCLMNIPDLSEYFLYANDDAFINRPVTPDYFFDKNNNPILMLYKSKLKGEPKSLYMHNIRYSQNLINKTPNCLKLHYQDRHNVVGYRKSYLQKCKTEFIEEFNKTTYHKFRMPNSVQRTIYSLWQLKNVKSIFHKKHKDQIHQPTHKSMDLDRRLKKYNPVLVCYNDTEYATNEDRKRLKIFLEKQYSQKQDWEIGE